MQVMSSIHAPISIGELLDKISILFIKYHHTDSDYVSKELDDLIKIAKENNVYDSEYILDLFKINSKLWKIEDKLRILDKSQSFDQEFIEFAKSVYKTNDQRASIKKIINEKYQSLYREIKCYKKN
jgi:hypothetical protein